MEPSVLRASLVRWLRLYPEPPISACKHDAPLHHGCPVWQLFHVIAASTAASVIGASRLPSQTKLDGTPVGSTTVHDALTFIKDVVDNFLDCSGCRKHFHQAFTDHRFRHLVLENASSETSRARSLVLWLWHLHNTVSQHLLFAATIAQIENSPVDRRWPTYRDCPGCWKEELVTRARSKLQAVEDADLDTAWDVAFDTEQVFWYLMERYVGPENSKAATHAFDMALTLKGRQRDVAVQTGWMREWCSLSLLLVSTVAIFVSLSIRGKVVLEERLKESARHHSERLGPLE